MIVEETLSDDVNIFLTLTINKSDLRKESRMIKVNTCKIIIKHKTVVITNSTRLEKIKQFMDFTDMRALPQEGKMIKRLLQVWLPLYGNMRNRCHSNCAIINTYNIKFNILVYSIWRKCHCVFIIYFFRYKILFFF